ncbi:DUF1629 domain-containing protein [Paraglaciecola sp.]|uniref:imm11 family protein n=1 Tax=Paraglaciecola sp. TaxID=1920173 RepID=UPI0030F3A528
MGRYYRVLADPKSSTRWFLKSPIKPDGREIDPRLFTCGKPYGVETQLNLPLRRPGIPYIFNFCDFDMVVVSKHLNEELEQIVGSAIQRIPILVEGTNELFEILNVVDSIPSIDQERSEYLIWQEKDGRPEKVGQYRMFTKFIVDKAKVSGHKIFRPTEWPISLIVDDDIKMVIEQYGKAGVVFDLV